MRLKVVKFDTKMYLDFSNFRGRTSAGGDKPWSKNGDKCRMGGIGKIFAGWGDPQSPPGKKTLVVRVSPLWHYNWSVKGAQAYYSKLRFHLYVGNLHSMGLNLTFQ